MYLPPYPHPTYNHYCAWCVEQGYAPSSIRLFRSRVLKLNPGVTIDTIRVPIKPVNVIDYDKLRSIIADRDVILKSLDGHQRDTFVWLLVGCTVGLRKKDLGALTRENVFTNREHTYLVNISSKTRTDTKILLPAYCLDLLGSPTLLPPIKRTTLAYNLPILCKHLGIANWDKVTPHTFRKTACTSMLVAGVPERVVKLVCGFSDTSKSFSRYVSLSEKYTAANLTDYYTKLTTV